MGFYFRKSIRVGPLCFNLSKSGVGVSTGIPGFRIGTGPRGNYVHMGTNGFYYRATLPSNGGHGRRQPVSVTSELPRSHAPLEYVGSSSVSRMTDSSSAALLSELNLKKMRIRRWPFALGLALAMVVILLALKAPLWIIIPLTALAIVGVILTYQFDLLSKTVVILYDFDSEMEVAYDRLHECVDQITGCGGKWHIDARGRVYDPKYHAGADQLVNRNRLSISTGQPPYVKTNIAIPVIHLGSRSLYFFPERLLVFARNRVGAVSYEQLGIVVNDKRFIEDGYVPRDASVVDRTWQYVNKGGGPDRRFKDNRELPICLYEELWLNSPSGLNEVFQLSRTGIGQKLDSRLQDLADIVARGSSMPIPPLPSVEPSDPPIPIPISSGDRSVKKRAAKPAVSVETLGPEHMYPALLEVLCCLMVSDGRASRSEKRCIEELFIKLQSPWSGSEVEARIAEFIDRVQSDGYRNTLAEALKNVEIFRHLGKEEVLLQCLDAVANADEKLDDRELQLCQRVRAIVE